MMLGLKCHYHTISPIPSTNPNQKLQAINKPFFRFPPTRSHGLSYIQLRSRRKNPMRCNAEESDGNGPGRSEEAPRVNLRWGELVLDPDRNNVVAVGLTGALAWAGVWMMWQLFIVTMAILIAAIKYTFVGVLICGVITLL
ncbi:hypothetical protein R6Q59_008745 [Mikania micrantha]